MPTGRNLSVTQCCHNHVGDVAVGWSNHRVDSVIQLYFIVRGRVDDLSFFEYLRPFCFCQLCFILLFLFLIKYYHILFITIVFRLVSDKLSHVSSTVFPRRDQSRDVTPLLEEGG